MQLCVSRTLCVAVLLATSLLADNRRPLLCCTQASFKAVSVSVSAHIESDKPDLLLITDPRHEVHQQNTYDPLLQDQNTFYTSVYMYLCFFFFLNQRGFEQ